MKSTVASEGVEAIETEKATFDPHLHMAVSVEDSADYANDEIIAEFQKGYKMKGKLLDPQWLKFVKIKLKIQIY